MGLVLWHTMMSLDGFIAEPNDDMQWAFGVDSGPSRTIENVLRSTGALLVYGSEPHERDASARPAPPARRPREHFGPRARRHAVKRAGVAERRQCIVRLTAALTKGARFRRPERRTRERGQTVKPRAIA